MKLLYRTAEWHELAKLQMHTDTSLQLLTELTTEFGQLLRQFRDLTCSSFTTVELPQETATRARQKKKSASSSTDGPGPLLEATAQNTEGTSMC